LDGQIDVGAGWRSWERLRLGLRLGLLALEVFFNSLFHKSVGTFGEGNGDFVFAPTVNFGSIRIPALTLTIRDIMSARIRLRADHGFVDPSVDGIREGFFGFGSQFGNGFTEDSAGEGFEIVIFTDAVQREVGPIVPTGAVRV
jgi:hypothetical protein